MGTSGPVQVSYPEEYSATHAYWHDTFANLGLATNRSHLNGSNVGPWTSLSSVDPQTVTRSSSAAAYYRPVAHRPNLAVLTEALVCRIILEKEQDGDHIAQGAQYTHHGRSFTATATKEVIVCAGSVQSPQILELSGIGHPDVLAKAGVETKVPSRMVGENLQDHMMAAFIYEVDPDLRNADDLKNDPAAAAAAREEYAASRTGPLAVLTSSMAYLPFDQVMPEGVSAALASKARAAENADLADLPERNEIRRGRFDPSSPQRLGQIEYIFDLGNWNPFFKQEPSGEGGTGKKYGTMLQILQYPFSRGSIHIVSASPHDKPAIDPRYYRGHGGTIDLDAMVECARFADKITQTMPLAGVVRRRVAPPQDADMREWLVDQTISDW